MPLVQSVERLLSAVGPVSTEVVNRRWSSREVVECRWSDGPVGRLLSAVGPVSREVVECRWSSQ